jgi:hypothetical protein
MHRCSLRSSSSSLNVVQELQGRALLQNRQHQQMPPLTLPLLPRLLASSRVVRRPQANGSGLLASHLAPLHPQQQHQQLLQHRVLRGSHQKLTLAGQQGAPEGTRRQQR